MVTDTQVRRLMSLIPKEKTLAVVAAKAGMDEKTTRKYRGSCRLPRDELERPLNFQQLLKNLPLLL